MSAALKVALAGSGGRMGRALLEAVLASPRTRLHAALEASGHAVDLVDLYAL